jgi:hypothetical protein
LAVAQPASKSYFSSNKNANFNVFLIGACRRWQHFGFEQLVGWVKKRFAFLFFLCAPTLYERQNDDIGRRNFAAKD